MNVELLAAGTRSPDWVTKGVSEYQKRLPREWSFQLKEIPVAKRHKGEPVGIQKKAEGEKMLALLKPDSRLIALDSRGSNWSTEKLAQNFGQWQHDYRYVYFMVGGPDGLADKCLEVANDTWSLSRLTFPHFVVRILLAEQFYRAWAILNNHPYHK
ncbi:MAG: 23S rRNA (pseudouridine(1915)-N(3))-methyltransferase RlmH [Pseudomonadales bacterium]|nr:23S rRNA (pseudouridine(1915)-N(3))-methyltransferase RlmH [Pseudomonadales bacterium]